MVLATQDAHGLDERFSFTEPGTDGQRMVRGRHGRAVERLEARAGSHRIPDGGVLGNSRRDLCHRGLPGGG